MFLLHHTHVSQVAKESKLLVPTDASSTKRADSTTSTAGNNCQNSCVSSVTPWGSKTPTRPQQSLKCI